MKRLYILIALAIALAIANASVFVYYPITVNITGAQPVAFDYGSNANQQDLGSSNDITVTLGANNASAIITIHPTYQYTYYHDIILVKNIDTDKSYYVAFRVTEPITDWPDDSVAKMLIYDSSGSFVAEVDLKQSYTTDWIGPLSADNYYRIDFYIYYPEGYDLPSETQVQVQLIYSLQNIESAPTVPP